MPLWCRALFCVLSSLLVTTNAAAQDRFSVQLFRPTANQTDGFVSTQSSRLLRPGLWQASILYNHGQDALVFEDSNGRILGDVVNSQGGADILAAYGITEHFELGLAIPLNLYQAGNELPTLVSRSDARAGAGIGDLRLLPTIAFPSIALSMGDSLGTAFALDVALPTGDRQRFQGDGLRIEPRVIVEYVARNRIRAAINAGYVVRDRTEILYLEVDDAISWGFGFALPLETLVATGPFDRLDLLAEANGEVGVAANSLAAEEAPIEALLGARAIWGNLGVHLGAGAGVLRGYRVPTWRVIAGISFVAGSERDSDHDGIANRLDQCPNAPEDLDYFADDDGCPDYDNDGDSLVDVQDSCPNIAEDMNDFEDGDGCPDQHLLDAQAKQKSAKPQKPATEPTAPPAVAISAGGEQSLCTVSKSGQLLCTGNIDVDDLIVYFNNDSTVHLPESNTTLRRIARLLATHVHIKHIWLEGHADDRASKDYNAALSFKRAQEVRQLLVGAGISPMRVTAAGLADERRVASGSSEFGQIMNKRVELRIAPPADVPSNAALKE